MNFLQSLVLDFIFTFFLLKTGIGRVTGSLLAVLHISDNARIWQTLSQYGNSSDSLRWLGCSLRQDLRWSLNLNNNTRVHRAQFLSTHLNRNLDGRSSHLYFLWRKTLCLSAGCPRQIWRTPLIDPLDGNRPAGTHCFNLLFSLTIQYFYGNCSDFGTEASFSNSFYRIILFFISFLELRYLLWSGLSGLDSDWNAPWEMHWLAGLAGRARVRGDRTGVATASITPDWPRSLCLFTLGLILDRKHSLFTINNTWYSQHHPHQQHQQHHQDHRQDRGQLSPSRVRVRGQTSLT